MNRMSVSLLEMRVARAFDLVTRRSRYRALMSTTNDAGENRQGDRKFLATPGETRNRPAPAPAAGHHPAVARRDPPRPVRMGRAREGAI